MYVSLGLEGSESEAEIHLVLALCLWLCLVWIEGLLLIFTVT